jgi:phosphoheptose isomerase/glycosyltransferase involved in cell wall biosynthesis
MKVAMVSEHASPLAVLGAVDAGGQNVHVAALASELAGKGHSVRVHTRRDDPFQPSVVEMPSGVFVELIDAGPARYIPKDELLPFMDCFAETLRDQWERDRPDIVHSHFWMSGRAALSAARELGIPVVHTFHALGVVKQRYQGAKDTSPKERLQEENRIIAAADHIIATCTDEMFELRRLGADLDRVTIVPCGVDLHMFRPDGPVDEGRPGMRRAVIVSRLVERKGIGNAIVALSEVPNAELVIAGGPLRDVLEEDPEAQRLRGIAERWALSDRVELRGAVTRQDVAPLLRSADVVICVPWYEPFGIVALEAMACGVPVIASAVGGLIDTVVSGETGLHVAPRDPARITEALTRILSDDQLRERLGAGGLARAVGRYSWARVASSTLHVYEEVLRSHNRPSIGIRNATSWADDHVQSLIRGLSMLNGNAALIHAWAARLASRLREGHRLLVVGNGGSAAQAQHLAAELVGRFDKDRPSFSAIALCSETSSLTAIANDYGVEEMFARQVQGHGRAGDILLSLSTSGTSSNILRAVQAARSLGMETWGMTGPEGRDLRMLCDETITVVSHDTATIQELHLVHLHLLCKAFEQHLAASVRDDVVVL